MSSGITTIACSEVPVAVSRMTVLRPKVSMCRCEGSPSPHELSFTRVRRHNDLSMSLSEMCKRLASPMHYLKCARKLRRGVRSGH